MLIDEIADCSLGRSMNSSGIILSLPLSPQAILLIIEVFSASLCIECSSNWTWEVHNRLSVSLRRVRHGVGSNIKDMDSFSFIGNYLAPFISSAVDFDSLR